MFFDFAGPQTELSSDDLTSLEYLEIFVELGLEVRFLDAGFHHEGAISTRLLKLGVETLDNEWFRQNQETWLGENGHGIDYVFFRRPDAVSTLLSAVLNHTQAAIICQLENNQLKPEHFDRSDVDEVFICTHSDVLLAPGVDEEEFAREKYPGKKVFTVPPPGKDKLTARNSIEWMMKILSASRYEADLRIAMECFGSTKQESTRLIAFYLPQYHPIPENDEWWGEGFTEWRNVSGAKPLFSGHYQPHVPADLGYYDLRQQATQVAQADLAKQYGIEGFCYYHYWFNGKRLLDLPIQKLIESGEPDFPFCLCWANESWSRRWDGKGQDILIKQEYSEDDDRRHIQYLIPFFKDKRYIRVNRKPIFLVYRTEDMPDPARTAEIWREEAQKAGIGDLYLCRVESFAKSDPKKIYFDAGIEFAPDWWNKGPQLDAGSRLLSNAETSLKEVCENNFIHSYQGLADAMMSKDTPEYKWFRCVTPSWDNWARRNKGASVFIDSTPDKYRAWLAKTVEYANERLLGDERFVFINAWNEWAEGNHLEPDQKFGHAYLEATKSALEDAHIAANVRRVQAADVKRMNRLIDQLATCRFQLDESEGRMQELLGSTSWRATVPLRWIKQQLLDLKKLFSK